jgi:hypothetical protein
MSKIYWWLVDISMYLVLLLFFLLVLLGIYFKTMIDKFCYKFFGTLDNICEWIAKKLAGKRCKCNSKKLEQEKILALDKTFKNKIKK